MEKSGGFEFSGISIMAVRNSKPYQYRKRLVNKYLCLVADADAESEMEAVLQCRVVNAIIEVSSFGNIQGIYVLYS